MTKTGLVLLLVLAGCADRLWTKPGATQQEFWKTYACCQPTGFRFWTAVGRCLDQPNAGDTMQRQCLLASGWIPAGRTSRHLGPSDSDDKPDLDLPYTSLASFTWSGAITPDRVTLCHSVSASDIATFSAHLRTQPQCDRMEDTKEATAFVCTTGGAFVGTVFADSEHQCAMRLDALKASAKVKARSPGQSDEGDE
jgi:hypothetical protein